MLSEEQKDIAIELLYQALRRKFTEDQEPVGFSESIAVTWLQLHARLAVQVEALADAQQQTLDVLERTGSDVSFWHTLADERAAALVESQQRERQAQAEAAVLRQALEHVSAGQYYIERCLECSSKGGHTEWCIVGKALSGTAGQGMLARLEAAEGFVQLIRKADEEENDLGTFSSTVVNALAALDADAGIEELPGAGGTTGRYRVTFCEGKKEEASDAGA